MHSSARSRRSAGRARVSAALGNGAGECSAGSLATACAAASVALTLTVRFEDPRQRHALDVAGDLPAATIRELARAGDHARIVVLAAGRPMIEEVHWGLTRVRAETRGLGHLLDLGTARGPPRAAASAIGAAPFSCMALAAPSHQTPRANLDLLPPSWLTVRLADLSAADRSATCCRRSTGNSFCCRLLRELRDRSFFAPEVALVKIFTSSRLDDPHPRRLR